MAKVVSAVDPFGLRRTSTPNADRSISSARIDETEDQLDQKLVTDIEAKSYDSINKLLQANSEIQADTLKALAQAEKSAIDIPIAATPFAAAADQTFEKFFFLWACLVMTIGPILFFPTYYSITGGRPQTLSQILSFLLILSSMHVALTLYFYLDKEYQSYIKEHRAFYIYLPVAVIVGCGIFTLSFGATGVVYLTIFYHAWLLFHYGRQNFGLVAFVCLSQGAQPLGQIERVAFHLAPIGAIFGAHAVLPEFKAALGSYAILSWHLGLAIYGLAVAMLAYASIASRVRDGWNFRVYFLILSLFWLPTFLFDSYQKAIMGYAVAHALQYFVFMYFSAAGNRDGARRGLLLLGMGAVFGWIILWISREKELWGPALYFMLGAELGLVMWHFIVDAGLWKLREKWQRERVRERFAFIYPVKR